MGTAWKRHERRTAKRLGGQRVGATGTSTPDVVSAWLVVECKERQTLPAWLGNALVKVRQQAAALGSDRLGLVVAHELGQRSADDWVIMTVGDFAAWFGDDLTAHSEG